MTGAMPPPAGSVFRIHAALSLAPSPVYYGGNVLDEPGVPSMLMSSYSWLRLQSLPNSRKNCAPASFQSAV